MNIAGSILRLALVSILLLGTSGCSMEGTKKEWSELQGLEYDNRNNPITKAEFREENGRHYLCVPALDGGERIWILLNPKYPPYYKQMPPDSNFVISVNEFNAIERSGEVSETVLESLNSHLVSHH